MKKTVERNIVKELVIRGFIESVDMS